MADTKLGLLRTNKIPSTESPVKAAVKSSLPARIRIPSELILDPKPGVFKTREMVDGLVIAANAALKF